MKRLAIGSVLFLAFLAAPVQAERPVTTGVGLNSISSSDLKVTPEMWFYDQAMRQYKDPKVAVRAKAELRAQQRQQRLESMKWFGFSNSRPRASSDPIHGDYSPGWVSTPGFFPSRWSGEGQP
jgi:hypothetical protein